MPQKSAWSITTRVILNFLQIPPDAVLEDKNLKKIFKAGRWEHAPQTPPKEVHITQKELPQHKVWLTGLSVIPTTHFMYFLAYLPYLIASLIHFTQSTNSMI